MARPALVAVLVALSSNAWCAWGGGGVMDFLPGKARLTRSYPAAYSVFEKSGLLECEGPSGARTCRNAEASVVEEKSNLGFFAELDSLSPAIVDARLVGAAIRVQLSCVNTVSGGYAGIPTWKIVCSADDVRAAVLGK